MEGNFNIDLAKRFISDYKLPIPDFFSIGQFAHYLHLCEKDYENCFKKAHGFGRGSMSKSLN